jgi:hypothetical protein
MPMNEPIHPSAIVHDAPVPSTPSDAVFGSDYIAAVLRTLDIPYISLVPGSSYRGLHDSLVNYLGNRMPQMVLSIHEENAVAIAHGYAKASDKMMAAAVHANIGLMRAVMAVYNAWCDRAPILLFGATGPWDAARRRAWIDWIHTSADQGALIRNFTKWDNQPGSHVAAGEAMLRAAQIALTAPRGPVYLNLEVAMQEARIAELPPLPDAARYTAPPPVRPAPEQVTEAARLLSEAKQPVIFAGRCSRSVEAWNARVQLAEKLNAPVVTNIKLGASFPTDHRRQAHDQPRRPPGRPRRPFRTRAPARREPASATALPARLRPRAQQRRLTHLRARRARLLPRPRTRQRRPSGPHRRRHLHPALRLCRQPQPPLPHARARRRLHRAARRRAALSPRTPTHQ